MVISQRHRVESRGGVERAGNHQLWAEISMRIDGARHTADRSLRPLTDAAMLDRRCARPAVTCGNGMETTGVQPGEKRGSAEPAENRMIWPMGR